MLKIKFNPEEAKKENEADRKGPRTEDKRRKEKEYTNWQMMILEKPTMERKCKKKRQNKMEQGWIKKYLRKRDHWKQKAGILKKEFRYTRRQRVEVRILEKIYKRSQKQKNNETRTGKVKYTKTNFKRGKDKLIKI